MRLSFLLYITYKIILINVIAEMIFDTFIKFVPTYSTETSELDISGKEIAKNPFSLSNASTFSPFIVILYPG